ncbi:MAG: hypothetical protein ACO2OQ_03750 [Thermofilaceae archaeon]
MAKRARAVAAVAAALLVVLLVSLLAFRLEEPPQSRREAELQQPRDRVKLVRSFAVYYEMIGSREEEILKMFDMVIIQDYAVRGGAVLSRLNSTLRIGYLNLAKYDGRSYGGCRLSDWRDIAIEYDPSWKLYVVDTRSDKWRDFILCAADYLFKMGFDGVMFDDVDVAGVHPELKDSMAELIAEVRRRNPEKVLGLNRGFALLDKVRDYIDFVLVEDLGTMYDFSINDYRKLTPGELDWLLRQVDRVKQLGLPALSLAYSREPCDKLDIYARKLAAELGLPVYTSNWDLSELRAPYECREG